MAAGPFGGRSRTADVTAPGWLDGLPRGRPAIAVSDGLHALLGAAEFTGMARSLSEHVATGELAFNDYSRLAVRNARRAPLGPLAVPVAAEGIDDPREAENWGARLETVEERFLASAPEIARFPPVLRALTRLTARSTRLSRAGDRILRYRFTDR